MESSVMLLMLFVTYTINVVQYFYIYWERQLRGHSGTLAQWGERSK